MGADTFLCFSASRWRGSRRRWLPLPAGLLLGVLSGCLRDGPTEAQPQTVAQPVTTDPLTPANVFSACYARFSGLVTRIKEPGTKSECPSWSHVPFKWTDGVPGHDHGALNGRLHDSHPQYLLADGTRVIANGLAFTGAVGFSAIPAEGPGARLMWYVGKAAFRAGRVTGNAWDDAIVGPGSVALGTDTRGSGTASTAMGLSANARADGAMATGFFTIAAGSASTTTGVITQTLGPHSTATGWATLTARPATTATGEESFAIDTGATAMGSRTTAGAWSTALGSETSAGRAAIALGRRVFAGDSWSTAIGSYASAGIGSFVYGDASTTSVVQAMTSALPHTSPENVPDQDAEGRVLARVAQLQGQSLTTGYVQAMEPNRFVVRAAGGFRFRTSPDLATGCDLAPGSGTWSCTSDRHRKENFSDEDGQRILARIAGLPVQSWNYRTQNPAIRHLGPTAQDFFAAFGLGGVEGGAGREAASTINTVDMDGVSLLAIQALERRTQEQAREIEALQADNAGLRAGLSKLKLLLSENRASRRER
jgi:endosialidase-like protein